MEGFKASDVAMITKRPPTEVLEIVAQLHQLLRSFLLEEAATFHRTSHNARWLAGSPHPSIERKFRTTGESSDFRATKAILAFGEGGINFT